MTIYSRSEETLIEPLISFPWLTLLHLLKRISIWAHFHIYNPPLICTSCNNELLDFSGSTAWIWFKATPQLVEFLFASATKLCSAILYITPPPPLHRLSVFHFLPREHKSHTANQLLIFWRSDPSRLRLMEHRLYTKRQMNGPTISSCLFPNR